MSQLPSELTEFVRAEVASGRYRSEDEVIEQGLVLLRERQRRLDLLKEDLAPALERLDLSKS